MKVFVTGWDGLLGSAVVPRLQSHHEVSGFGVEDGDVGDPGFVRSRMQAFAPDVVLHLAAMTAVDACEADEEEAFRVNAEGSRVVAGETERLGASIVALSTDYVFDGQKQTPYGEDDAARPLSVYGRSKLAGEEAVKGAAVRWAVVRSAWLVGPGGRDFVDAILELLDSRETVSVVADQVGSPTYAPDLADALVAIVGTRGRGLFHIVNGGAASWCELARETARLAGLDPERIRPASTAEINRPAPRPPYSVLTSAKAKENLGVVLRPWREALAEHLHSHKRDSQPGEVS